MRDIHTLVRSIGVHATYKGFHYITYGLYLAKEDETRLQYVTKHLYPLIALKYDTTVQCVERDIRTVINICWRDNRELLQGISPYTLKLRPSIGEFLDLLYWALVSMSE